MIRFLWMLGIILSEVIYKLQTFFCVAQTHVSILFYWLESRFANSWLLLPFVDGIIWGVHGCFPTYSECLNDLNWK